MRYSTLATLLVMTLLSGCTSYVYSGSFDAQDSFGNDREFQVYWRKTEYLLLYGVANDPISLRTECSLNTVLFEDSEDGIVFRKREGDNPAVPPPPRAGEEVCGLVPGADQVTDIEDGTAALSLQVWCRPVSNSRLRTYLQASEDPYVVDISRAETDTVPDPPTCR